MKIISYRVQIVLYVTSVITAILHQSQLAPYLFLLKIPAPSEPQLLKKAGPLNAA
jgi:hypothetical protein